MPHNQKNAYICVKLSNTTNLLKPGYRNSLYKFIRTTCFGHYSTIIRSTRSWNMQRATNYFGTQWDPIEFTILYKTL